jgi:hypothetical protein
MCADCGRALRELLIGDGTVKAVSARQHPRSQPGIIWYIKQLYKAAYRQSRLAPSVGKTGGQECSRMKAEKCDGKPGNPCDWCDTSGSGSGGLLADTRATVLLHRIAVVLSDWEARCYTCKDRVNDQRVLLLIDTAADYPEALCIRQARFLAAHVRLLRRHDKDVLRLHNQMLSFAREAWVVINQPPQLCCGKCPNMVTDKDTGEDKKCSVIMYAEETAKTVQCPKCRATHDVEQLREQMRSEALDYVLPASELRHLMETRLNDRIPKSSFYQLVRDGRLRAHSEGVDGVALYTYQDVCAARALPPPERKVAHNRRMT